MKEDEIDPLRRNEIHSHRTLKLKKLHQSLRNREELATLEKER
jgi:hypothetical protein